MIAPRWSLHVSFACAAMFLSASAANATVWGLKSQAPSTGPSSAPTTLFSFAEDGTGLVTVGNVTVNGLGVDADGLAISQTSSLFAYALGSNGSQLLWLNSLTAQGTPIGSPLSNREIRGAAFSTSGELFALDAKSEEVLRIDGASGSVLSSISFSGVFDIGTGADLVFRSDGGAILLDGSSFYLLDLAVPSVTLLFQETVIEPGTAVVPFYAGIAYSSAAGPNALFAYEVNGTDDIYRYDATFSRSLLYNNIVSGFNSGRGDLAAIVVSQAVPEPATLALLGLGLAGLGWSRRRIH